MSYDINFWKQERPLELPPVEVYKKLCKREPVEGLAKLPVEAIHAKLKQAFPQFDPADQLTCVETSEGSIEFSWSDQHFRFDIRGICGECQKLVEVMSAFGCPMYDPQENKRYDAQGGMALGEVPQFESPTPEEKAEWERVRRETLAKFSTGSEKQGCRGAALLLCSGILLVIIAVWRWFT